MSKVTPEKTHALLEKLATYVMNEVPTKNEMNDRFEQVEKKFEHVDKRFDQVENRLDKVEGDVKLILDGMDNHPAFPGLDLFHRKKNMKNMRTDFIGNLYVYV